jgi:ketosteroid isomerase-like protein
MITLLACMLVCLGDPKANLEATAAAYDLAVSKADVAALETILAPEVVFTTASGRVMDKKAVLAMLGSPDTRYDSVMSDQVVRTVSGDTAIETGRARIKGTRRGQPVNEIQRYTDVWIFRKGRWLLLAEHTSLLP